MKTQKHSKHVMNYQHHFIINPVGNVALQSSEKHKKHNHFIIVSKTVTKYRGKTSLEI